MQKCHRHNIALSLSFPAAALILFQNKSNRKSHKCTARNCIVANWKEMVQMGKYMGWHDARALPPFRARAPCGCFRDCPQPTSAERTVRGLVGMQSRMPGCNPFGGTAQGAVRAPPPLPLSHLDRRVRSCYLWICQNQNTLGSLTVLFIL